MRTSDEGRGHTPGPWRVLALNWGWQVLASPDKRQPRQPRVVVAVHGQTSDPQQEEQARADAVLIAAAPDLLAACKDAMAWLDRFGAHAPSGFGGEQEIATALANAIRHAESWAEEGR